MVIAVDDVHPIAADSHPVRPIKLELAFAEYGGQRFGHRIVFANHVIHIIGDEHIAVRTDRQMLGSVQLDRTELAGYANNPLITFPP